MKKIKLFLIAIVLMIGTTCYAEDFSYLTIQKNDASNTEQSFSLSLLSKLTFSNGSLILTMGDGTTSSFTLTDLNLMFFSNQATGIQSAQTSSKLAILNNGVLTISTESGAKISLFQTNGALVRTLTTTDNETEINIGSLPKGIYLLKINDKVQKILNR